MAEDKNEIDLRRLYKSRIYRIWSNMKTRCTNPKATQYENYGGRGIRFTPAWNSFEGFYVDMSDGYSDELSLDRIDNDEGYSKDNCRWTTREEQCSNRSSNKIVEINGEKKTLARWIRTVGAKPSTVRQRYYVYGWSIEKALGMEVYLG
ncbi:hypothetical protein NG701_07435 [Pseudarthrobacter sp. HLT3-5]|uniref:hypothetical protein n=1 Tax=Pseudarthrobacter cellobiosi TaxID=2953654 RepID=UPI00208FD03B|nr:hypothetical protein [Pseudarthrobacter sp. HLT3-5]MCO4274260.1 hypothetical protein [Pseudarthrobacter sp. HLT3-5]